METIITEEMLTEGQVSVRDDVRAALTRGDKEILVGGAAGVGKTTMLKLLADEAFGSLERAGAGGKVKIAAPTNRAAKVLRSKLPRGYSVTTLHYLLGARPVEWMTNDIPLVQNKWELSEKAENEDAEYYSKVLAALTQIKEWEDQIESLGDDHPAQSDAITNNIRSAMDGLREFSLSAAGISASDIVICDEASMVSDELRDTTLKTGATVVWIGDPFQLEPVKGTCWFTPPSSRILTQVMRQAGDSGILALATMVRQGCADTIALAHALGDRPDVEWLFPKRGDIVDWERLADEYGDKWLTWRNGFKTRNHTYHTKRLNDIYRYTLGFTTTEPRPGDRLYILERFSNNCKSVYMTKGDEARVRALHYDSLEDPSSVVMNDCPAKPLGFDEVGLDPDFLESRKGARDRGERIRLGCVCKYATKPPLFCNGHSAFKLSDEDEAIGRHPWPAMLQEAEACRFDLDIESVGGDWRSLDNVAVDPEAIYWDEQQGTRLFKVDQRHRTKDARRNFSPRFGSLKATYAYCGSVHQSQGGEWDFVTVFWDPAMLRMNPSNAVKWLYTAITRAAKRICIVTI